MIDPPGPLARCRGEAVEAEVGERLSLCSTEITLARQQTQKRNGAFLSLSGLGWGRESHKALSLTNQPSAQIMDPGQGCIAVELTVLEIGPGG